MSWFLFINQDSQESGKPGRLGNVREFLSGQGILTHSHFFAPSFSEHMPNNFLFPLKTAVEIAEKSGNYE